MIEKEIELLEKQISMLDEPKFDLKVWKSTTMLVLERIFGKDSEKIRLVNQINFDYSSWTLRDTMGASSLDICKRQGRQLLETTISELRLLGLPQRKESGQVELSFIQKSMEDVLRISQYRELVSIINDYSDTEERKKKLAIKLQGFGDETVREMMAAILSIQAFENLKSS